MADEIVIHEVEVVLTVSTTHADIWDALERSGVVLGKLIGEALIEDVRLYSPEEIVSTELVDG